jgi:integrase
MAPAREQGVSLTGSDGLLKQLMYAYIVLSLLAGLRTEEARALRWSHVNLDGDLDAEPPVPPHVAVWRSVRLHGETKTERSRRTLALPRMAVEALVATSAPASRTRTSRRSLRSVARKAWCWSPRSTAA